MKVIDAYLLATQAQKIPENPDSGMVKKNGLYYPEWATDYLLVPAQIVSNTGQNTIIPASQASLYKYGTDIAAGQESGGYCLFYHTDNWSYLETHGGWSVDRMGVSESKACVFTFSSLQKAKMALLTGQMGDCVWHSDISGHSLQFLGARFDTSVPSPYTTTITGIYSVIETDGGTIIGTMNLGTYYASSGWRVRLTYTAVWDILAARALT